MIIYISSSPVLQIQKNLLKWECASLLLFSLPSSHCSLRASFLWVSKNNGPNYCADYHTGYLTQLHSKAPISSSNNMNVAVFDADTNESLTFSSGAIITVNDHQYRRIQDEGSIIACANSKHA